MEVKNPGNTPCIKAPRSDKHPMNQRPAQRQTPAAKIKILNLPRAAKQKEKPPI
jgi:hypothetical protein